MMETASRSNEWIWAHKLKQTRFNFSTNVCDPVTMWEASVHETPRQHLGLVCELDLYQVV